MLALGRKNCMSAAGELGEEGNEAACAAAEEEAEEGAIEA